MVSRVCCGDHCAEAAGRDALSVVIKLSKKYTPLCQLTGVCELTG